MPNANYIPDRIYERVSNLIETEHNDLGMTEVFVKPTKKAQPGVSPLSRILTTCPTVLLHVSNKFLVVKTFTSRIVFHN